MWRFLACLRCWPCWAGVGVLVVIWERCERGYSRVRRFADCFCELRAPFVRDCLQSPDLFGQVSQRMRELCTASVLLLWSPPPSVASFDWSTADRAGDDFCRDLIEHCFPSGFCLSKKSLSAIVPEGVSRPRARTGVDCQAPPVLVLKITTTPRVRVSQTPTLGTAS